LPLTITKSSDRKELIDAAFGKLKAHNMAEIKPIGDYELLYSDATVVEKLRESDEPFVLHKYKKVLPTVALHLCKYKKVLPTVALHFTYR
jgi:hypothetical protein